MTKIPEFKPGDLIKVYTKIVEGDKERITPFQGVVIQIKGHDIGKTFTVRKVSAGVGVERIFPLHSPMITKIEIKKKGKVRRAKLVYLRLKKARKLKTSEVASAEPEAAPLAEPVKAEEEVTKKVKGKPVEPAPGAKTVEKV